MLKVLDLFSGIGGFSLGLERTGGFETVAFCEIEKFPQKVLAKHWPGVPIYEDVKELTAERLATDGIIRRCTTETDNNVADSNGECRWPRKEQKQQTRDSSRERLSYSGIDVITGGFPCQDISVAGKQAGIRDGDRSSLFDEIIRLTRDIRPRYVICENVSALLSGSNGEWFSYVLTEFSRIGYDVEWESISAQEVGAWHKRDRVWIMAYPNSIGEDSGSSQIQEKDGEVSERNDHAEPFHPGGEPVPYSERRKQSFGRIDAGIGRLKELDKEALSSIWATEPELGRVANGIPDRSHRLKGLGNAVVPQIPELIGRAILENESS